MSFVSTRATVRHSASRLLSSKSHQNITAVNWLLREGTYKLTNLREIVYENVLVAGAC